MTLEIERVNAARRGDAAAYGVLVDRWTQVALAVAFVRTGRRELAAEVTQEAFPFRVAEDFLGRPGVRVPLADTVRDTTALLAGPPDPVAAEELRYVGALDRRGSWPKAAGAPF